MRNYINPIMQQLEKFIELDKFSEDLTVFYPGLSNMELKVKLTDLINLSARDFMDVLSGMPTDEKFRNTIKKGLNRIDSYEFTIDSEDQDKICSYYEELMDIVGLGDSGGHLNKWRYDLDL